MSERVGFIGQVKGHKIFFDGRVYYYTVGNKNYTLDETKVDIIRWTPGC